MIYKSTKTDQINVDGGSKEIKLHNAEFIGLNHKFQLELLFFPNAHQPNGEKQICLRLYGLNKITKKERYIILPLHSLPWLRKEMAKMLAKHDGTETILLKATAQIPKQFFSIGFFF